MSAPHVYSYWDRPETDGLVCEDDGQTRQEFKDECDINVIMARYIQTGIFPENVKVAQYGDFSEVGDYQEALARIENAEAQFAGLPAKVRDRFGNDPERFLMALHSGELTLDECEKIGLLSDEAVKRRAAGKAPPPAGPPAEVVPTVVPPAGVPK